MLTGNVDRIMKYEYVLSPLASHLNKINTQVFGRDISPGYIGIFITCIGLVWMDQESQEHIRRTISYPVYNYLSADEYGFKRTVVADRGE
jgi:hypothetical protein